jgi:hypothetical protein
MSIAGSTYCRPNNQRLSWMWFELTPEATDVLFESQGDRLF